MAKMPTSIVTYVDGQTLDIHVYIYSIYSFIYIYGYICIADIYLVEHKTYIPEVRVHYILMSEYILDIFPFVGILPEFNRMPNKFDYVPPRSL